MTEVKAKFHFIAEAMDARSTVVKVKTIQLVGQSEIFQFPCELQTSTEHVELFKVSVVKGVVKSLKTRNKFRNVVITLSEELQKIYLDYEGNVVFHEYYLEEAQATSLPLVNLPNPLPQDKPVHSISKSMVIDKFNGEKSNAKTWLNLFVTECKRLDIHESKYTEILRLFLEGPALDWYLNFLKINSLSYPWEFWNNSFTDTFAQLSWSEIEYAHAFKYLNGSYLSFALKKRSLLIDIDPDLTLNSQINLIMIALPPFVRSKFIKKDFVSMEDLMSKLRQLEPKISKQNKIDSKQENYSLKKPCSHCEKLGYKNRFHPENLCRMKDKESKLNRNDKIRIVNSLELQDAVSSCDEAKNE